MTDSPNFEKWNGRDIVSPITVENIGEDRFQSIVGQPNSVGRLFGGQFMGLALQAASLTVENRPAHAASGFFLRAGDFRSPLELDVERSFDGSSFCARRVVAKQSGVAVFHLEVSFQAEEAGVEHQDDVPFYPAPESLIGICDLLPTYLDRIAPGRGKRMRVPPAIDLRPIDPNSYILGCTGAPRRAAWLRAVGADSAPAHTHCSILAYLTDYFLAGTAVHSHEVGNNAASFYMASLNQTLWFHRPFRVDDWLLFDCSSPSAQNGRGLGASRIFQHGRLVASGAQEALMRQPKPDQAG